MLDYYKAIRTLVNHKDRLERFATVKNRQLVEFLNNWDVRSDDPDNDPNFPDTKEIASAVNIARQKVNVQIKELYVKILDSFNSDPLIIQECVHVIYIHVPYDEQHRNKDKGYREYLNQKSLWFETKLPFVPRLGESISLDFIDHQLKFSHGYVNEIRHEIEGSKQRIMIYLHPFKDFYEHWQKMKTKFEWHKRMEMLNK